MACVRSPRHQRPLTTQERLGVDIGGVIISDFDPPRSHNAENEVEEYLSKPSETNAFLVLQQLVTEKFGSENVFLVSKAQVNHQKRTLLWLEQTQFFEKTGILPQNLIFCIERFQKREICEELCINYFIDDRFDVLSHVSQVSCMKCCFLFGSRPFEYPDSSIIRAPDWNFIKRYFAV